VAGAIGGGWIWSVTMAKRKDSLALFEVFAKKPSASPSVPAWVQKPAQPAGQPGAAAPAQPQDAPPPDGGTQVSQEPSVTSMEPPALPQDEPASTAGATPGWFEQAGGKVRLTLPTIAWLGVGAGMLALVMVAFLLGRMFPPVDQALGPILAGSGSGNGVESPGGDADGARSGKRIAGKYYLVIQGIKDKNETHYKDAEAIVAFLKQNGVPASVHELRSSYIVWSEQPMDRPDDAKALEYAKTIEELGKKYKAVGGYDFNQKGNPGGKPWYIPQTTK
jgi:hypothetical protein